MEKKILEELIRKYRKAYYSGKPLITDTEYDAIEDSLRRIDPTHPLLSEVGSHPKKSAEKIVHKTPMLSLDKCYEDDQLWHWLKIRKSSAYIAMPKLDGFAVSLVYNCSSEGLELDCAASRGDGSVGEDITNNIKQCRGVPYSIPGLESDITVRGEVLMLCKDFIELKMEDRGFSSARNTAAGTIRNKDPKVVRDRRLIFVAYSVIGSNLPKTHSERLSLLGNWGFCPVPYHVLEGKDLIKKWTSVSENRKDFPYDIDGMVVGIDDVSQRDAMGYTSHHPKGMIACKFDAESEETKLREVLWQVSRTGLINPVAFFDSVVLDGASITKATLHNLSEINRLGLKTQSKVVVARQGGVIPKIVSVVSSEGKDVLPPKFCPSCQAKTKVVRSSEGIETLYCTNLDCDAAVLSRVLHYVSCVGIEGLGESILAKLFDASLIEDVIDIYHLSSEDFQQLDKVGKVLADKLVNSIWDASQVEPYKYVWALGIPGVGKAMAKKLCSKYSVEELFGVSAQNLKLIGGIDSKSAKSISDFLSRESVRKFYQQSCVDTDGIPAPVTFVGIDGTADAIGAFSGKSFVLTGSMSKPRKEIQDFITGLGGEVKYSISKKINYLVSGAKSGSKLDKARKYGIEVISEEELYSMSGFKTLTDSSDVEVADLWGEEW